MKQWLQKNSGKIIIGVVIIAALTAAFFAGGQSSPVIPSQTDTASSAVPQPSAVSRQESSRQKDTQSSHTPSENVSQEQSVVSEASPEETSIESSAAESVSVPENTEAESSTEPDESVQVSLVSEMPAESAAVESSQEKPSSPPQESSQEMSALPQEESSQEEESSFQGESLCTIYISCKTAMTNDKLNPRTRSLLPEDGWILPEQQVAFQEGESVFDILKRVCRENDIRMEFSVVPLTNGAYIEGINYLYEFDCGPVSGWMYSVNGDFKSVGCSECRVSEGDSIEWQYSCDLGADIGNYYYGEGS